MVKKKTCLLFILFCVTNYLKTFVHYIFESTYDTVFGVQKLNLKFCNS